MANRIREFLIHVFRDKMSIPIEDAELTDDLPLGSSGLDLESIALVELAQHAEQELGVRIPDGDFDRVGHFTVGELISYLDENSVT